MMCVCFSCVSSNPPLCIINFPSLLEHAGPRALCGRPDSVSVFVFSSSGFSLLFLYSLAVAPLLVSADETLMVALLAGAILGPLMTK